MSTPPHPRCRTHTPARRALALCLALLVPSLVAGSAGASVAADTTIELLVAGRAGVPVDASAVVVNVTATDPTGPGFVTVWPCGEPRPLASNLNYTTGQTTPNLVVSKVGVDGKICLYSRATVDLVADVMGAFPAGGALLPLTPARLLDTRTTAKIGAANSRELVVGGRAGVPVDATAVVVNVTATDAAGPGFVTVWPCGVPRPLASNLNYTKGQTTPNLVVAKLGVDGKICLYSSAAVDVVVDVDAAFPAGSAFIALTPARLLDTRTTARVEADTTATLPVVGRAGVPADAVAVVVNVTATDATAPGFVTVWPCGEARPLASNLNYTTGQTTPNLVMSRIGAAGDICLYAKTTVDLVVDVTGAFPAGTTYRSLTPTRLLDTRLGESGTCVIGPPPSSLGLATFYMKYCDVRGLPIVAAGVVRDDALRAAWTILDHMLSKRPDTVAAMQAAHIRFGIIGELQQVLDMPEYADLGVVFPGTDWNARARGLGATVDRPLVSVGEENLLCLPGDRYRGESIAVHEFGHTFLDFGVSPGDPGFAPRIQAAFAAATGAGRWANTYAATNAAEYWAEGVQDWFDANLQATPADGIHNEVNTRAELAAYDPTLAALLGEVFATDPFVPTCPGGAPLGS